MSRELFSLNAFCSFHQLEHDFITSLQAEGLIDVVLNDEGEFIEEEQLPDLETYTRWHHELGINPEGIDAIRHLLKKMRDMQNELMLLRNRLKIYEE